MANFAVANSTVSGYGNVQAAMAGTYKTLCAVAASTQALATGGISALRRGKVYDILVGTNATPVDSFVEWTLARATVTTVSAGWVGALSSVSSAIALDTADNNIGGLAAVNSSNEGNVALLTAPGMWYVGVNSRASYRWVAAPGSEILYPAVSSGTGGNGLVLQGRSGGYTGTATGTVLLSEL